MWLSTSQCKQLCTTSCNRVSLCVYKTYRQRAKSYERPMSLVFVHHLNSDTRRQRHRTKTWGPSPWPTVPRPCPLWQPPLYSLPLKSVAKSDGPCDKDDRQRRVDRRLQVARLKAEHQSELVTLQSFDYRGSRPTSDRISEKHGLSRIMRLTSDLSVSTSNYYVDNSRRHFRSFRENPLHSLSVLGRVPSGCSGKARGP